MTPRQQRFRILIAPLFCFLIGDIVGIGCAADPCAALDCPPGTTCVEPSAYGTLGPTGKFESVTPDPQCVGPTNVWGAGEPASAHAGFVLVEGDGGSCPLVPADAGPCAPCMISACCTEATACFGDGGACSPTDPVGTPLARCITDHCAAQCPGVP